MVSITAVCVFLSPLYITALRQRLLVYARCSLVHAVIARIPIQLGGRCTVFFFCLRLSVYMIFTPFFFSQWEFHKLGFNTRIDRF